MKNSQRRKIIIKMIIIIFKVTQIPVIFICQVWFPYDRKPIDSFHAFVSRVSMSFSLDERSFFPTAVVTILLYGWTTRTLSKRLEKKLGGIYTRMLGAILNKSWRQHPTMHELYGHQPPITKTIQARRTRHAVHCRRNKDELISDVLLWTLAYGQAKAGRSARTYIHTAGMWPWTPAGGNEW